MPIIKQAIPLIDGFMNSNSLAMSTVDMAVVGHVVDFKCITRSMTQYTIEGPSEELKEALKIREKYNPKGLEANEVLIKKGNGDVFIEVTNFNITGDYSAQSLAVMQDVERRINKIRTGVADVFRRASIPKRQKKAPSCTKKGSDGKKQIQGR